MTLYVGVDGGQSGLRIAVAGTSRRAEAAGFSYGHADPYAEQLAAIEKAWARLGRPGPVAVAALGLSGAPGDAAGRTALAERVARLLSAEEVRLGADMVTAHLGALPDRHGVVLAAGTGVAALGVDARTGATRRVDAWGHLLGDDGSAFATGRAGLAAVLRAYDGRGPATALTAAAVTRYGPVGSLSHVLYDSPTVVTEIAAFAVDVAAAAAAGDPTAVALVTAAGVELARTAAAAAAAVVTGDAGTTGETVPLAGTGRWFSTPGLHEAFVTALADVPRVRLVPAAGDALAGACALAAAPDLGPYRPYVTVHGRAGGHGKEPPR